MHHALVLVHDDTPAGCADKVVPDLGLVICIYDVEKSEGGHIYPGDGAAHYEVCPVGSDRPHKAICMQDMHGVIPPDGIAHR